jgi:hypothetical protein
LSALVSSGVTTVIEHLWLHDWLRFHSWLS